MTALSWPFPPRNPRHRILLCTPKLDIIQELYQVLGGLLWWPASYSLHGFRRWDLWVEGGVGISPVRYGTWACSMGWIRCGSMRATPIPQSPGTPPGMNEFSGVLWGLYQDSPRTGIYCRHFYHPGSGDQLPQIWELNWPTWNMPSGTLYLSPPPTGKAYSLGRAEYGRLGLGEGAEEKSIPTLISRLPAVSSVACGASVGYAVTKDGEWGCPHSVWLGLGGHDSYQTVHQPLMSIIE